MNSFKNNGHLQVNIRISLNFPLLLNALASKQFSGSGTKQTTSVVEKMSICKIIRMNNFFQEIEEVMTYLPPWKLFKRRHIGVHTLWPDWRVLPISIRRSELRYYLLSKILIFNYQLNSYFLSSRSDFLDPERIHGPKVECEGSASAGAYTLWFL